MGTSNPSAPLVIFDVKRPDEKRITQIGLDYLRISCNTHGLNIATHHSSW